MSEQGSMHSHSHHSQDHHSHEHHSHGHHSHRRHGHSRSHRKRQALIWGIVLGVCVVAIVALMVLGNITEKPAAQTYGDLDKRFAPEVTLDYNGVSYGYRNGRLTNILFIGIDQRDIGESADNLFGGGQADFMLLVCIDRENRRMTPIQLDRDTITEFVTRGVVRRTFLCAAQSVGSSREENCLNTVNAVSGLLKGIPIDYYVAMDMSGIGNLADALRGVTVTVPEDLSYLDPALTNGATVTLHGPMTETFVRSRQSVVANPTNTGRMRRQRVFLLAAADRFTELIQKDLDFINEFLDAMDEHVVTNIPRDWFLGQLQSYLRYDRVPIIVPEGVHTIGERGYMEFYPDDTLLTELVIHTFFEQRSRP